MGWTALDGPSAGGTPVGGCSLQKGQVYTDSPPDRDLPTALATLQVVDLTSGGRPAAAHAALWQLMDQSELVLISPRPAGESG